MTDEIPGRSEWQEACGAAIMAIATCANRDQMTGAVADLLATTQFFILANDLDADMIEGRGQGVLARLLASHLVTMKPEPVDAPDRYSAQWLAQEVARRGAASLTMSACATCSHPRFWSFDDGKVWINAACACGTVPPVETDYQNITDWLAEMPDDATRETALASLL